MPGASPQSPVEGIETLGMWWFFAHNVRVVLAPKAPLRGLKLNSHGDLLRHVTGASPQSPVEGIETFCNISANAIHTKVLAPKAPLRGLKQKWLPSHKTHKPQC